MKIFRKVIQTPVLPLALVFSISGLVSPPAQAVQFADGTVAFEVVPTLQKVSTNFNAVKIPRPKYDFQFAFSDKAREGLKKISFEQRKSFDSVAFNLDDTVAYLKGNQKQVLPIQTVSLNSKGAVVVTFAQPIAPGTEFTVRLRPKRNPRTGGTYLFGVTAFPDGEKANGQFLGFGRLLIFDSDSSD